jgi:uncharacterized protein YjiS (DUF1127 family)
MRFWRSCSAAFLLLMPVGAPILPSERVTGREPEKRKRNAMFASIVRLIREYRRYNQSLAELSRLGDRELADIGISRSDIHRVAWDAAHQH